MLVRDVVVVGAGPSGLATAISARQAGLSYAVLEKGVLVNSLANFPTNMVYFTTPELLEIGGLPFVTPYAKPTRVEALTYYRRVVDTHQIEVQLGETVTRMSADTDPQGQRVIAVETVSQRAVRRLLHGRAVVIATGAYDLPNLLDVPGEDLPHVSHYYKEAHPYFRRKVVIVGGQNSAAEAALELYRAGAEVVLVHRGEGLGDSLKYWVRPDIENRITEGAVVAMFNTRVVEIRPTNVLVERHGEREEIPADAVLLLTGYQSDTTLFDHAGISYDPVTCAPRLHPTTYETSVPGIYVVGAATTGRQSGRIFIENGRFHGQQVVRVIASRLREPGVVAAAEQ